MKHVEFQTQFYSNLMWKQNAERNRKAKNNKLL